jgi:hypothetical protein
MVAAIIKRAASVNERAARVTDDCLDVVIDDLDDDIQILLTQLRDFYCNEVLGQQTTSDRLFHVGFIVSSAMELATKYVQMQGRQSSIETKRSRTAKLADVFDEYVKRIRAREHESNVIADLAMKHKVPKSAIQKEIKRRLP